MRKQETEFNVLEPLEPGSGARTEEPAMDAETEMPAPQNAGAAAEAAAAGSAETAPAMEAAGALETVSKTEFEELRAERDRLLDRLARLQAEFDNARKRAERERMEFRDYAAAGVIEQFLPVLDNFELALKATGSAHQLRSGVALIVKQMEEVLARLQVTPVPAAGEAFDPRIHEALGSVERDDVPDQHVAEEVRRGYRLRDRLLRPALVRVAHNPKPGGE